MTIQELKSYVACEEPRVIINPKFKQLDIINEFDRFVYRDFDGNTRYMYVTGEKSLDAVKWRLYNFLKNSNDFSVVDDYYFLNSETGEVATPFVAVKCNHCVICDDARKNDLSLRASFQVEQDHALPYLITLTYDNEHLPFDGVDRDSVKSLIKRFKTYYSRYYKLDSSTLKFLVTSEYGELGRPHYHILLFGYDCNNKDSLYRTRALYKLMKYIWSDARQNHVNFANFKPNGRMFLDDDPLSYGGVEVKLCDSVKGVVKYVTKYITKDLYKSVPEGKNPNFKITPYNFGTGFFFKFLAPQIMQSLRNSVKYLPFSSTSHKELHLTRYYINKLFPCVSNFISGDDKKLYQYLLGYFRSSSLPTPDSFRIFDLINVPRTNFSFDFDVNSSIAEQLKERFLKLANRIIDKYGDKTFSFFANMRNLLNTSSPRVPYPVASRLLSINNYNNKIKRKL